MPNHLPYLVIAFTAAGIPLPIPPPDCFVTFEPPELPTVPTNDSGLLSEQFLWDATSVFRSRVLRAIFF